MLRHTRENCPKSIDKVTDSALKKKERAQKMRNRKEKLKELRIEQGLALLPAH